MLLLLLTVSWKTWFYQQNILTSWGGPVKTNGINAGLIELEAIKYTVDRGNFVKNRGTLAREWATKKQIRWDGWKQWQNHEG